jgi:hypothetical protein
MRNFGAGLFVLCLVGCSADADGDAVDTTTATAAEPLSNHEHCDTATANATVTGFPAGGTFAPPYGNSQCSNAFLVDIPYAPNTEVDVSVLWAGPAPNNSTDCTSSSLYSYSWRNNGLTPPGGSSVLNDVITHGTWVNGACQIPSIPTTASRLGVGGAANGLRFAISARGVDGDFGNVTYPVALTATAHH